MAEFVEGWWHILVVVAGVFVAWGSLKSDVKHLREQVNEKASKDLVEAQYKEIIGRLTRIEGKLNGIK